MDGAWPRTVRRCAGQARTRSNCKDDLYVIHNDFVPGNTTALITNQGVVLVDDKFEVDHDGIMAELKKITNQPVKYVINTHHHADHSGGNAKMQQLNAVVVASEQAVDNMFEANQPGHSDRRDRAPRAHLPWRKERRDLPFRPRAHQRRRGRVVPCAAHAGGGRYVHLWRRHAGADRLLRRRQPKEWTNTLDSALDLDFDTVVPGHGVVTTKQEMRKFRDSTLQLRNRVHELVVQKKTRDDIAKMLRTEFHWADLHLERGLDGVIAENQ